MSIGKIMLIWNWTVAPTIRQWAAKQREQSAGVLVNRQWQLTSSSLPFFQSTNIIKHCWNSERAGRLWESKLGNARLCLLIYFLQKKKEIASWQQKLNYNKKKKYMTYDNIIAPNCVMQSLSFGEGRGCWTTFQAEIYNLYVQIHKLPPRL